jgi:hypothetical protein
MECRPGKRNGTGDTPGQHAGECCLAQQVACTQQQRAPLAQRVSGMWQSRLRTSHVLATTISPQHQCCPKHQPSAAAWVLTLPAGTQQYVDRVPQPGGASARNSGCQQAPPSADGCKCAAAAGAQARTTSRRALSHLSLISAMHCKDMLVAWGWPAQMLTGLKPTPRPGVCPALLDLRCSCDCKQASAPTTF